MSWAEVYKVNSDFSTPLDVLQAIQYLQLVGNEHNFDSDTLTRICYYGNALNNYPIAAKNLWSAYYDDVLGSDVGAGAKLAKTFAIDDTAFQSTGKFTDILADDTLLAKLAPIKSFVYSLPYITDEQVGTIYNSNVVHLANSNNSGIWNVMLNSNFEQINRIRENTDAITKLYAGAKTLLNPGTHTVTVNKYPTWFVLVGTGADGYYTTDDANVSTLDECSYGGKYLHACITPTTTSLTCVIDHKIGTNISQLGLDAGVGGGAKYGLTTVGSSTTATKTTEKTDSTDKFIEGSYAGGRGSTANRGGGGGYGGGNGGWGINGYSSTFITSYASGGAGVGTLGLGTVKSGGDGGSSTANISSAQSGSTYGGGGGGGGWNGNATSGYRMGCGGGGGFGGGGGSCGAGGGTDVSYSVAGKGGTGCILIID